MDLELVEARWRIGHILTGELRGLAGDLRAAGHEVPALARLAERSDVPKEDRQAFERALRELGRGGMTRSDAALVVARRWATLLLSGEITPRAGAKAIARLRFKGGADLDEHLLPFERLDTDDATKRSRIRRAFTRRLDRATRAEARKLLSRKSFGLPA